MASYEPDILWDGPAQFAASLTRWLMDHDIAPHVLLNVNFPNRPVTDLCGVQVTTQGPRQYVDRVMKRTDPTGRDYYWLGGTVASHDSIEGTDVRAIADGKISITPLHLDLTAHTALELLKGVEELT